MMTVVEPATWAAIRMVVCDVDGVLTDGGVYMNPAGDETKRFDIKDGAGLRALVDAGLTVAFISSRIAPAAHHRATELGVRAVFEGVRDKWLCVRELAQAEGIDLGQVAYMGDDVTDASVVGKVGIFATPADATPALRAAADYVAAALGGRGAVRELSDRILAARFC